MSSLDFSFLRSSQANHAELTTDVGKVTVVN